MYLQTIYITKQSTRRIYKQTDVYLITIEIERGRDKRVQMVHLKNLGSPCSIFDPISKQKAKR